MFPHGEQLTWRRFSPAAEDDYGNIIPGDYVDEELTGAFAPESTQGQDSDYRVVSDAKIYLRATIPFSSRDRFIVRGVEYAAIGDSAGGWKNPFTGFVPGQEILLRRVTG